MSSKLTIIFLFLLTPLLTHCSSDFHITEAVIDASLNTTDEPKIYYCKQNLDYSKVKCVDYNAFCDSKNICLIGFTCDPSNHTCTTIECQYRTDCDHYMDKNVHCIDGLCRISRGCGNVAYKNYN